ncbi:TorF family putative porin [Niveibacterium umoris]|uniref:Uncharacterized protein (TIGR02001 family) n=1 Tax=Niveibacterium umoris TaxID=1193620 RepID=A0A840BKM8_9RHOO|nr:TorF family putative porin [Niveibacterium umoris]MBB4013173.1 uncharacterized protein (TIGR02001 family) [Niveibacterium umoris]
MRKTLIATALLASFAASAPAMAEEAKAPYTLTGNFTLASEYLYRGIAQTNHKPAIQGGVDFAHESGIYLGTWGSNISWLSDANGGAVSAPIELDFYGGYKGAAGDFGYDVGLLQYYYPGTYPDGYTSPNTLEGYVAGSYKWITLKGSYSFTNLFGTKTPSGEKTNGSYYLDATATFPVAEGINLIGHVGYQNVKGFDDASYTDYKLGGTADALGLTFGLFYSGTNAKGDAGQFYRSPAPFDKDLGAGRVLLTVGKTL